MEMCYGGALVMPSSYVLMDEEEMTYVEGGVYISNSTLRNVTYACFFAAAINPIGATLIGLGVHKIYTILAAGVAKIAAKLGAVSRVLGIVFGVIGVAAVLGMGYNIADALIQGKGINIGVKKTWFGMPYGIDVSVC